MPFDPTQLPARLFWDVDPTQLDAEVHARFIIRRVVERGRLADVKTVWAHYGPDAVKAALIGARSLDRRTVAFFANQFGISTAEFRASSRDGR